MLHSLSCYIPRAIAEISSLSVFTHLMSKQLTLTHPHFRFPHQPTWLTVVIFLLKAKLIIHGGYLFCSVLAQHLLTQLLRQLSTINPTNFTMASVPFNEL